mmetsp:Transcript_60756/g.149416  ORF Transcript_60756/g.149416 Transcript_60756/m.149416 type:complete len:275 (+) Transcript_60756:815-1639(+)
MRGLRTSSRCVALPWTPTRTRWRFAKMSGGGRRVCALACTTRPSTAYCCSLSCLQPARTCSTCLCRLPMAHRRRGPPRWRRLCRWRPSLATLGARTTAHTTTCSRSSSLATPTWARRHSSRASPTTPSPTPSSPPSASTSACAPSSSTARRPSCRSGTRLGRSRSDRSHAPTTGGLRGRFLCTTSRAERRSTTSRHGWRTRGSTPTATCPSCSSGTRATWSTAAQCRTRRGSNSRGRTGWCSSRRRPRRRTTSRRPSSTQPSRSTARSRRACLT